MSFLWFRFVFFVPFLFFGDFVIVNVMLSAFCFAFGSLAKLIFFIFLLKALENLRC